MAIHEDYESAYTGQQIDEAVGKIRDLEFMTEPTSTNKVATEADLPSVPSIARTTSMLKGDGNGNAKAWGCDLTYDYVKINGDYRT